MNSPLFSSSPYLSLLCSLLVILLKIQSCSSHPPKDTICGAQFKCGNITADYPFSGGPWWDGCGPFEFKLTCEVDRHDLPTMMINHVKYRVLEIKPEVQILRIARMLNYLEEFCAFFNTTFDSSPFNYASTTENENVTLNYNCLPFHPFDDKPNCHVNGVYYKDGFVSADDARHKEGCNANVSVPVPRNLLPAAKLDWSDWQGVLQQGFNLKWEKLRGMPCENCTNSKGNCGFDHTYDQTICYCPHITTQPFFYEPCPYKPPAQAPKAPAPGKQSQKTLVIGVVGGGVPLFVLVGLLIFCFIRKRRTAAQLKTRDLQTPSTSNGTSATTATTSLTQSIPSFPFKRADIERGVRTTYFGAQVFDYTELEQATDNFHPSKELGDGGFGTVYYGVLKDGRAVAVKRLYENSLKRVDQFMNEVEILTKLRHPNLVTLYGCTSRHSRELLLVYEYIPNGTVADHIHASKSNSDLLPWHVRLGIAVETADALAFLHTSEVIHRDVKTNNILLENNYHVKVADFGLSRLFPTAVTHVSTAPQGTPGYVDPEYYQCYHLTDKSDVYSFGVVLIELISSLEAVDTNRHRHDINLANMAVNKIHNHALSELIDPSLGFEKDYTIRSMVTSMAELAFRCLQQDRDMRPTMQEVLEVLKGIQNEQSGVMKAEVVDICTEDIALSKNAPPPNITKLLRER